MWDEEVGERERMRVGRGEKRGGSTLDILAVV